MVMTTIISNGRLLNEHVVRDCIERGTALFELPLLSHKREVHDQLSGSAGAFDAVLSAMANIRYHSGKFVAVFVLTQQNFRDLYETIRLAYAFGASGLMLNRFNAGGRGRIHMKTLQLTLEQLQRALGDANLAAEKFNFTISSSIPLQPCLVDPDAYPNLRFGFCAAGSDHAYYTIDPMGNLRPCNHSTSILGNLFEDSFGDLIAGDSMKTFVDAVPKFCAPCKLKATCQGGCKAAAQVCSGSLSAEEPFLQLNRGIAQPILEG
jgi:radical SAM protein with 4Fe4S-binding SPASM domain